jgi:uncharacterized protein involved in outer membrane biogenesis
VNSFLLTVAGFVIAALTLAFTLPLFIDWNSYRHVFEAQASKLVGRNVFVGGDVRLRLLPTPLLRFGEVRIADDKGQIDTPFVQAESFTVWLSAPALMSGAIEAREIEIERPVVNLRLSADGQANWRDMGPREGELAFMPREVALGSVKLTDATIVVYRTPVSAPIKIEDLTGEFSARGLDGPYKFAGAFRYDDVVRDLRFSTGVRQPDGSLRLKLALRDGEATENIVLDGSISSLTARPSFDGDLLAQFAEEKNGLSRTSGEAGAAAQAPLEVRAKLATGLDKAILDELELTIRNDDKPQTMRGRLSVSWLDGLNINGDIASRWLDLDAFGVVPASAPQGLDQRVMSLLKNVMGQSARIARGQLHLTLEKARLAGDVVSDIDGQFELQGEEIIVSALSLGLPGSNRLQLNGTLAAKAGAPQFAGSVALEGGDLKQLLKWSGYEYEHLAVTVDAGFAIEAAVQKDDTRFVVSDAKGQLFGSSFDGGLRYEWDKRPTFSMDLASERLDFTKVFGQHATVASLLDLANSATEANQSAEVQSPPDASATQGWLTSGNARIDLRVASATLPGVEDGDLAIKVSLASGDLTIQRLILRSSNGLVLRAEGGLVGLDNKPSGRIMLTADAAKPEGIEALWSIMDLPAREALAVRAERLAPMRIAIAIESKSDDAKGLEARLGGAFDKSNIEVLARYTGDIAELAKGRFDVAGTIGNGDGAALVRQLFPELDPTNSDLFGGQRAEVSLKADGQIGADVASRTSLEIAQFRWEIDGTSNHSGEQATFDGQSTLRANDVERVLALAGMRLGPRAEAATVIAKANLKSTGAVHRFSDIEGQLGADAFSGAVEFDITAEQPSFAADLSVDNADMAQMLRPLLAWHRKPVGRAQRRRTARRRAPDAPPRAPDTRWAERSFDTDAVAKLKGRLSLKAKRLALAGALVMDDAELEAVMENGKIDVAKLAGNWAGGQTVLSASLQQREQGLAFSGEALIKQADLSHVSALGRTVPMATGRADLKLSVAGAGLTPKGLASSLSGSGKLDISQSSIRGLSAEALRGFAQSEVDAEVSRASALPARAALALQEAQFDLAPASVAINVKDGVVQLDKTVLHGPSGEAAVTSFVELASMKLDSEWSLAVAPRDEANQDLQLTMVFAGPINQVGQMKPRIDTKTLQRHITVLRIARDVELRAQSEEARRLAAEAAEAAKQARAAEQAQKAEAEKAALAARAAEAAKAAEAAAAASRAAKATRAAEAARAAERAAAQARRQAQPDGPPASRSAATPPQRPPVPAANANEPLPWATTTRTAPAPAAPAQPPSDQAPETAEAAEDAAPQRRTSRRRARQPSFDDGDFSIYSN